MSNRNSSRTEGTPAGADGSAHKGEQNGIERGARDASSFEGDHANISDGTEPEPDTLTFENAAPIPPPPEPHRRQALVVPPLRLDFAGHKDALKPSAARRPLSHADWLHAMDVRDPPPSPREDTQTGLGPLEEPPRTDTLKSTSRVLDSRLIPSAPLPMNMTPDVRVQPKKTSRRAAVVLATAVVSLVASVGVAALTARVWRRVVAQEVTSTRSIYLSLPTPESLAEGTLGASSEQPSLASSVADVSPMVSVANSALPAIGNAPTLPPLTANKSTKNDVPNAKQLRWCPCDKTKKRHAVYDELLTTDGPVP